MDGVVIERIRQKLLDLKTELETLEKTSNQADERVDVDQASLGEVSRMGAIQAQQMSLESSRPRQRQLLEVEAALHRIDSDEYGYCTTCDEAIDPRRLLADPTNTHCISCAD
jgi:DnaK suppressor protein